MTKILNPADLNQLPTLNTEEQHYASAIAKGKTRGWHDMYYGSYTSYVTYWTAYYQEKYAGKKGLIPTEAQIILGNAINNANAEGVQVDINGMIFTLLTHARKAKSVVFCETMRPRLGIKLNGKRISEKDAIALLA